MSTRRYPPAFVHPHVRMIHQGKTRDTFEAEDKRTRQYQEDKLLVVATNRLSTHNVVHKSQVQFKGEVLTALTIFWLKKIFEPAGLPHHLLAYGRQIYDHLAGPPESYPVDLHRYAIVVKKIDMIPVEFIYRDYLCGSLWKLFYSKGLPDPYGLELQPGLPLMRRFGTPLFTPTDKSETDEPLNAADTAFAHRKAYTLGFQAFIKVRKHLARLGIELVDSKFELGVDQEGQVVLGDEIATPDSSRYCRASEIYEGIEPPWLDKQIVRNEAERIWGKGEKVPLEFDPPVIDGLSRTYLEVFQRITGQSLPEFQREHLDAVAVL